MFDIGLPEMLVIGVLIIIFFPPDDLPELMRTLGRWYGKIRGASDDLRRTFNTEVARVESDKRRDDLKRRREERERLKEAIGHDPDRLPDDAAPRRMPDAPPPGKVAAESAAPPEKAEEAET